MKLRTTATDSFYYVYNKDSNITSMNDNSFATETYGYDGLQRENSFTRAVNDSANNGFNANVNWQLDVEGNHYDGAPGSSNPSTKYGLNYAGNNHKTSSFFQTGNESSVTLPAGNIDLVYDAWGRVVSAGVYHATHAYSYDALGRQIADSLTVQTWTDSTHTQLDSATTVNLQLYSGQNVIEDWTEGDGAIHG